MARTAPGRYARGMHLLQWASSLAFLLSGGGLVWHSIRLARVADAWERQARSLARARGVERVLDAKTVVAPAWHSPRVGRETPGRRLRSLIEP